MTDIQTDGGTVTWVVGVDPERITVTGLAGGLDLSEFIAGDGISFGFDDHEPPAPEPTFRAAAERTVTLPMYVTQAGHQELVDVFPAHGGYFVIRWSRPLPESWANRVRRLRRVRALRRAYDGPRRTRRRRRRA
jgi:hypothetical protein